MNPTITIIGCGVSGLTTGVMLQEAGFATQILTAEFPEDTVSARAAALWFPFQMGPADKVNAWSRHSYAVFQELAAHAGTGIHMRQLTELLARESDAWWIDAIPQGKLRPALPAELPSGFALGYVIEVPIIETPIYLRYLVERYQSGGGTIRQQHITSLAEVDAEAIVNCTGLGARELAADDTLYPIRGQIVKLAPHSAIAAMAADMELWGSETDLAYIIPRSDCLVLGGNALPHVADLVLDEEATEGIRQRCERLDGRLRDLEFIRAEVGLRPGRPEVRLEREGNIIHNYGHGGGGYTVSWGCAAEVLELVEGLGNG